MFKYLLATFNAVIAIAVLYYSIVYLRHLQLAKVVVFIAIASLLVQLAFFVLKRPFLRKYYLYITMFNVMYLLVEFIVYLFFCYGAFRNDAQFLGNSLEATSGLWATFDDKVGYKGLAGDYRSVKYVNGEKVYDHTMQINAQGWFSGKDYRIEKTPEIKRYAVLGDSYSSGFNVPETWVDRVDSLLPEIELYNFSMEGIGIENWHLIYFGEVINYEFDGVIFAISNEDSGIPDLDRPLMIMHSVTEGTYIGSFSNMNDASDAIKGGTFAGMVKGYAVYDRQDIDRIISELDPDNESTFSFRPPNLYFLDASVKLTHQIYDMILLGNKLEEYQKELDERLADNTNVSSFETLNMKYPKVVRLASISADVRTKGKELMVVSIPDIYNIQDTADATSIETEMLVLSNALGAKCYNGFTGFDTLRVEELGAKFYKEDLHWNSDGIQLFSDRFADHLLREEE